MYGMKIRVRYSEVDPNGKVRLHQILEYFQDCGTFQSEEIGLGMQVDKENHRAWYLLAWDVKIKRHPAMSEYITVTTQAYKMRGFYGYRRYSIIDERGETIVSGESIWILMDTDKMLPMKISKELADKYVEKNADTTIRVKRKIEADGEWEEKDSVEITKIYLDSNNHVNNTVYALWAEEVIPEGRFAKETRIDYRKSAIYGDTIKVYTQEQEEVFRVKFLNQHGELSALVEIDFA